MNVHEPKPSCDVLDPPAFLLGDEVACGEWDRMVAILKPMGVLTDADGTLLGLYCANYSRWRKAHDELAKLESLAIEQGTGSQKASPLFAIIGRLETTMRSILAEFGCSPASRTKIRVDAAEADKLDEFIFGPKGVAKHGA